jgi:hypothetical protein
MKRARKSTKRQTSGASIAGEGGLQVDAIVESATVERGSAESAVLWTPRRRHSIPDLDPSSRQPDIDQANRVAVDAAIRQRDMIAATQSGAFVPPPPPPMASPTNANIELSGRATLGAKGAGSDATRDQKQDRGSDGGAVKVTKSRRMRTAVGRAARTNKVTIIVSVASLVVLIDEKLASLRGGLPNDPDAQAARDQAIAHYESVKRDLEALRDATLALERGDAKEKTVENAANTFAQGIANWWIENMWRSATQLMVQPSSSRA